NGKAVMKYDEYRDDTDVRFAASLDGGRTVLPSVIANRSRDQKPMRLVPQVFLSKELPRGYLLTFRAEGGLWDYAGLTADAEGSFHPDWIDFRNGVGQMWTTTIDVTGAVASVKTDILAAASTAPAANDTLPDAGRAKSLR